MYGKNNGRAQLTPFQSIALCLSGGGYWAAAFSMGTLSYLNHLKIGDSYALGNVDFISSTSGEVLQMRITVMGGRTVWILNPFTIPS